MSRMRADADLRPTVTTSKGRVCGAAAGLLWVQREIARFGGDPARITIFGESAGGALVAALLSRPDTAAIPVAAIIQSGPTRRSAPGVSPAPSRKTSGSPRRARRSPTRRPAHCSTHDDASRKGRTRSPAPPATPSPSIPRHCRSRPTSRCRPSTSPSSSARTPTSTGCGSRPSSSPASAR
ncbi:carboxylesterase family protein [Microbacterium sp. 2C]|nr:carboxylesterase family protein [Microbacterium paulum]